MSTRDSLTDAGRASGAIRRESVARDCADLYQPISVAEEGRRGGWDPKAAPTGQGIPKRLSTSGNRGADDAISGEGLADF